MAAVASPITRILSNRHESIRSDDWPQEINSPPLRPGDHKQFTGDGLNTGVRVLSDGRLGININERRPSIAGILNRIQQTPAQSDLEDLAAQPTPEPIPKELGRFFPLRMNIVIQVIGSRGDIQPFVALGKELKAHGHRVRLATHLAFREFVLDGGLEFFCIGGDPEELMAFMVQNPSLLPAFKTLRSGAIQKRRREMKEIIYGCWKSCIETGDGTDLHQIKDDLWSDAVDYRRRPFVADAIIANPPSLAHVHCAQRLGVPLHMMFTMPWSPTQFFPHPLAVLHQQDCKPTVANFVSYAVVDMMIWEGLGDLVNSWRKKCLALDELDSITAPSLIHRLRVPFSYLWSPSILAKPRDWPDHIDICGFSVLPAKSDFQAPKEIKDFLDAGPTPLYVGFGSIVVDDQVKLTRIVFEAIKNSGQRAIVSKGWGNLGVDEVDVPDNILIVGSVPHDWLFTHVSCVIHHGGAGTTAAGIALGRPTIIVPFFGDQQFWGGIVAAAGAGPAPISHKQLTVEKLTDAIKMALEPSTQARAQEISRKMQEEKGVQDGVRSFHRHLNWNSLRCSICPDRPAVWHIKHTHIALSTFAAAVLVEAGRLNPENVVLNRAVEYDTYRDPTGPISAGAQVLVGAIANFVTGLGELPYDMVSDLVSAGRAIGHPIYHDNPCAQKKRQKRRTSRTSSTGTGEEEEFHESAEHQSDEHQPDEYQPDRPYVNGQELSTDEDTETNGHSSSTLANDRSLELERTQTMGCAESPEPKGAIYEMRTHGSRMSKKLLKTIIWLPTDLTLSLSKGFHNAPKLYHDPMVKNMPKVVGFRSSLAAARTEFRDGFYYGFTGLVTQPRYGYQHEGAKGMAKGVGKGVCGVFLKPQAGLWGLAGYPLVGLRRKLQTSLGKIQDRKIIESRIEQGHEEMRASSAEERADVARKWRLIEEDLGVSFG